MRNEIPGDSFTLEDIIREFGGRETSPEELPDGRWMTRQAFWLNNEYLLEQIKDLL